MTACYFTYAGLSGCPVARALISKVPSINSSAWKPSIRLRSQGVAGWTSFALAGGSYEEAYAAASGCPFSCTLHPYECPFRGDGQRELSITGCNSGKLP